MRVDPVPLIRVPALMRVCKAICPTRGLTKGAVVLRLKDLFNHGYGVGMEELLSHESNLVVH